MSLIPFFLLLDLSEPIDVYSDFIDACKEAQEQGANRITRDNSSFQKVSLEAESGEEV